MSLRTRLILLTALWILIIVLFFNIFIYVYFQNQTTKAEDRLLWNKAQIILRNPEVHHTVNWRNPELLTEYAAPDTLLRIIRPDGSVALEYVSNEQLRMHPPVYRNNYHSATRNENGYRMLFIQVPLLENGKQIAILELGKALNVVNDIMDILVTGLSITTVGVILFSIVGGIFFTRVIIHPLRQLAVTMNEIRSKGDFLLLSPEITSKKDELGRLGTTFNEMIVGLRENDLKQKHFIASASHELKTPLTVIESYASLLSRWGSEDPAIRKEAVDAILSESQRLKGLIGSLLRLAEAEQEERPWEREQFDLLELIHTTVEQIMMATGRKIEVHCGESAVSMEGQPEQIKQLLIILLDNAVKYSEETIEVVLEQGPEQLLLLVKDYGVGIPESDLPHLFERFYRVDPSRCKRTGGSGLGLSIAKPIVQRHCGSIRIESREGIGTTVIITLPNGNQSGVRPFS
ncbi:HAMP domain-containing sensor histidine kinase [Paenibacillus filicis]|uniref:histidine kinase n=1 Tax=Paenibacillus gyeongsangnamensis TaxID=3388067 RepID=A0ABT4QGR4_9BACL|nr:HAMP domain-containing sensor histidine kinase [Paenibacillus filicis]MCZ8515998.1 HAMP domain-containing sensor histidine kinase [Paenibacillus filicis]